MVTTRGFLLELCKPLAAIAIVVAATGSVAAQTTTQQAGSKPTVTTEQMSGEVVRVDGNDLIVRMSTGELRTFSNVPDSRRATIDGKEVGVRDLRPGTRLTATITRTATPVTTQTSTITTGTVAYVGGNSVVLRLPNDDIKQYTVRPDFEFTVNGRPSTVNDLRQGMTVSAQRIVEEASVSFATNTTVTGQGPAAGGATQTTSAVSTPGARGQAGAAGGQNAASASASASAGAGAGQSAAATPAQLPKTASPLSLVGLLGFFLIGSSIVVRMMRRA